MLKLVEGLKDFVKLQEITTDGTIFRLHCNFTSVMLFVFSIVITSTQFVGSPIMCITDSENKEENKAITTFCWITSTFTMPNAFDHRVGSEVPHPGITGDFGEEGEKKYYPYYQWVCFALFLQAVMCYVPKYLWDVWEGGLLKSISMGLKVGLFPEEEREKRKDAVLQYLLQHVKTHSVYAFRYWFCEVLCLLNILAQLYFMDKFFDGEFLNYGLEVLSLYQTSQEDRPDPMVFIFPRVTKCTFHTYGPSGSIQNHDAMCILPLNIVNEKTYIFIWFWFMLMLVLLTSLVLYRAVMIFIPAVRPRLLGTRNGMGMVPGPVAKAVVRKTNVGDFWLLYMLSGNMDPLMYRDVMAQLAKKIDSGANNFVLSEKKRMM